MLKQIVKAVIERHPKYLGMENVVEKELLHHDILHFLHKEGYLERLTFIGGTALRMCYGSNRLSEDLDFTGGLNFNSREFDGLAQKLQQHLVNLYQMEVAVNEPVKDTSDTSTWKITLEKPPRAYGEKLQRMHIDVCAYPSLDKQYHAAVDHYHIGSKIAGLPIGVESQQEILADKIIAFAYRARRIKPRDVWDLAWLNQQQISMPIDMVREKLVLRQKSKNEFIGLIQKHSMMISHDSETKSDFFNEMSRFVTPEISANTLDNDHFWPYVGSVVHRYVSQTIEGLENEAGDEDSQRFTL